MTNYINPRNNPLFFQQFNETYLQSIDKPLAQYRLVEKKEGYTLEEKSSWSFANLFPCLFGRSLSIDRHAKNFLELASKRVTEINLENLDCAQELLACSKTCYAFKKLLSHVFHKRALQSHGKNLHKLQEQTKQFKTFSYEMLNLAASSFEVSPLTLACMNKMGTHALKLISQGAPIEAAEGHYTFLLELAYRKNASKELIFKLIELGGDVLAANIPLDDYLLDAIDPMHNSQAACKLLQAGANPNKQIRDGRTALHLACIWADTEVVKLMLTKGGDCAKTDCEGNTALHFACGSIQDRQSEIIKLLLPYSDVTKPNSDGLFPLEHPRSRRAFIVDNHNANPNPLEEPFLLQNLRLIKERASKMTYKEFTSALATLAQKYPKSPLFLVEFCHLDINPYHYKKGVAKTEIPLPPEGITLNMLLELFDQINFHDEEAPLFRNPELLRSDTQTASPEQFRLLLQEFIRKINERVAYLGTPEANSPALTEFYDTIEKAVKNSIYTLLQKKAGAETQAAYEQIKSLQDGMILEFVRAAGYCGGRYYNVAVRQFELVYKGAVPTFEEEIYQSLADFREILFQSGLNQGNAHDVHDYNYLLRYLGVQYGIPGSQMLAAFRDPYGSVHLKAAERKFLNLYTPQACILEWIEPQLKDTSELREKFVAWCKTNIPKEWQKEHFDPITARVKQMQKTGASDAAIKEYLQTKDIFVLPQMAPLDAIRIEREAAYLGTEVFNMETGKIKREAIIYLLIKIRSLSSFFIHGDEITFGERATTIVGGWVAKLRDWLSI